MIKNQKYFNIKAPVKQLAAIFNSEECNNQLKKDYGFYESLDPDKYSDELKKWYKLCVGKPLNLDSPRTFNEKIQWLKLHDNTSLKTGLTDKYLVRDWIKEQIGEKYLIPLLGVWNKFDDIDFDKLPDKFVLKANHGCGWNIIVKDKNTLDRVSAKENFDRWLNTNFAFVNGLELHYKDISPKIIAEDYLENAGGDLYDYKIWCFNGKPRFIMFLAERQVGLKIACYDLEWNLLPFICIYLQYEKEVKKPDNLDEMLDIAGVLCKDFAHVRVDFYRLDDGSLKFGEMTFTTASGVCNWKPPEYDLVLGQMLTLPEIKEKQKMLGSIRNRLIKIPPPFVRSLSRELQTPGNKTAKLEPRNIINFGIALSEHCNLKCRGCDHFAPLAQPEFADMDAFKNDFARLSELFNGEALKIGLMGGEPLLNPRVNDYLPIARKYFPKTKIRIVSNGLLLLKQKGDFWMACKENNIMIEITKYPINLDFDKMKKVAKSFGVSLEFYDNTGEVQKKSNHVPLDIEGRRDALHNFMNCYHANVTIFLKRGRLYPCTIAPHIGHFNKYFNMDLPISTMDSIDIYKASSAREIFDFLCTPIPLCRYCYVDKRIFGIPWQRSRKSIKEWTT